MKNWIYTLDVVRTGRSMVQDLENRCYACPWTKGNYSHKRSKYIGLLEEGKIYS